MAAEALGVSGLAGRYATALFELAKEQNQLDATAADLAGFRAMLDDSADLTRLVRSPVIGRDEQGRALAAVLDRAGAGQLVRNFIGLLARNRRLFAVRDIMAAFDSLCAAERGEITAEVTSAATLDEAQVAALRESLRKQLGQDVQLHTHVDESLLGGLVVKIGSRMIDSSLKAKLQGLRLAMKGIG